MLWVPTSLLFAVLLLGFFIFTFLKVPETRGRTFDPDLSRLPRDTFSSGAGSETQHRTGVLRAG